MRKSVYKKACIITAALFLGLLEVLANAGPEQLMVNDRSTPLGVSVSPAFRWEVSSSSGFNVKQKEYRIFVATRPELLSEKKADLWDSGLVSSDKTFDIVYHGKPLASSSRYYWKVTATLEYEVKAEDKVVTRREQGSNESSFTTAILSEDDWKNAAWITMTRKDKDPLPVFRRTFQLNQPKENIDLALVHLCGLGHYTFSVNGKVQEPERRLDPGWTNYKKTCLYSTFDIGSSLCSGDNTLDVVLGNGMFNVPGGRYVKYTGSFGQPKMTGLIHLRYRDGSTQDIISDTQWKAAFGPIQFSCVYGGEDVFLDDHPFDIPVSNKEIWKETIITKGPGGQLTAQEQPPVRVFQHLKPEAVSVLKDGRIEADFGFNFSGQPILVCRGKKGQSLTITLAERKGLPWSGHSYTVHFTKDNEEKTFRPLFTYWGFQFIYISGAQWHPEAKANADSNRPIVRSITADYISTSSREVGHFESDGPNLNEIDKMVERSVRSNLQSVVTDCPHREKLGWLEVPHLMGPAIFYRYDVKNLYRKITKDMEEAQLSDGMIPDIAPEYTRFANGFFWSAEWSSAAIQVPWFLYRWYGDQEILKLRYPMMERFMDFMVKTRNKEGLARPGLGDWYDWTPEKGHGSAQHTPAELTATAFLYSNAEIMMKISLLLDKKDRALYYKELAHQVKKDFQKAYYQPKTGKVSTGSQAAYAFALYFRLIPDEDRARAMEHLTANIIQWKYRPTVGEVAYRFLVRSLADNGRDDIQWKMLQRSDAPGYVHMLKVWKMKTLSETWDGPGSSMNHCMFGHIQEWFMSNLAGISQTEDSVAFSEIRLCPDPVSKEITSVKGSYRSIHGLIESQWNIKDGQLHWKFTIPGNSCAVVEIPVTSKESSWTCQEKGGWAVTPSDSEFRPAAANNRARRVLHLGSGNYEVISRL